MKYETLYTLIRNWFTAEARDLPWRRPECSPWGVMVSEYMLQQTPVVRVLPRWLEWMNRWPSPADLAAEPSGEAVRAWDRLGYPRRALRLHAAATAIVNKHDGEVPASYTDLLALPGVGSYTAAAIASFAFGRRETVVDTNIRRVHARLIGGRALPEPALTAAEMELARRLLPADAAASVQWNAGVMELGATVCTARSPKCEMCPVLDECAWVTAGRPAPHYRPKGQSWAGTDRQLRGAILAVLRASETPVVRDLLLHPAAVVADTDQRDRRPPLTEQLARLHALRSDTQQLERALAGLVADELAQLTDAGVRLPV